VQTIRYPRAHMHRNAYTKLTEKHSGTWKSARANVEEKL
jgi:hypothetical protein